jgi:hypothetical protein
MTYLDTPIDATVSAYRPAVDLSDDYTHYSRDQIKQMVYDLGALAKENETFRLDIVSLRNTISALQRQNSYKDNLISNAKVLIVEAFDGDEFGKDVVNNIAEALEIQLTKEYKVKINVMFSGTITAPIGLDEDDFGNDIEYSASLNNWRNSDEMELDLYEDVIDFTITN